MINIINKKDCVGCNACVQRCPTQCISMSADEQGFLYPKVDVDLCIECGLCERVCPVINQDEPHEPIAVYAAHNKNPEIVRTSSSGGVFYALAKHIIDEGGVVFGARFDDDWQIIHDWTETVEGLKAFQGSKYVQSRIGDCYLQAEKFLKERRKVLFSGTPCQLAGLRLFLRKDYGDLLLSVDVVCHGVPSPLVWKDYLHFISLPKGATGGKNTVLSSLNVKPAIAGISFRDKRLGWEKYGFAVRYATTEGSGKNSVLQSAIRLKKDITEEFFETFSDNLYMQCFLENLCLRPSCYSCPSKCGKSHADITLADFWGIYKSDIKIYDKSGVSLLMIMTYNGTKLLEKLNLSSHPSHYDTAIKNNPAIIKSSKKPEEYSQFWLDFQKTGIKAILKYRASHQASIKKKIFLKIKSLIKPIYILIIKLLSK